MYGHLVPRQDMEGRKAVLERGALCGMSVLRALVPLPAGLGERRAERRIYRAALRLWDAGVARVLTPEGFSQWPALRRAGLGPVETQELCRSAAAPLALAALTVRGWEPGRAVVALAGARVSAPLFQAAETLARQVCRLVVEAPV